jgi:hypothetical protein
MSSSTPREPKALLVTFRPTTAWNPRRSRCLSSRTSLIAQEPHSPKHLSFEMIARQQRDPGEPQLNEGRPSIHEFRGRAPAMRPLRSGRSLSWVGGILTILLPITLMFVVMKLTPLSFSKRQADDLTVGLALSSSPVMGNLAAQPSEPEPRLIVQDSRAIAGEPVPLGLTMQGLAEGAVVIITGTIPGMTFSSGSATGRDTWQMAAKGLPDTWVGPPKGFVGAVDLTAELRLDDDKLVQRQPIRIEWISTSPAVPIPTPTRRVREAALTSQQLEQDEISLQTNKGTEQNERRTYQRRGASKAAASTSRKGRAKASARTRAPVYALPTQLTRASWPGW